MAKRKSPEDAVQTALRLALFGGLVWMGIIAYQVKKDGTI